MCRRARALLEIVRTSWLRRFILWGRLRPPKHTGAKDLVHPCAWSGKWDLGSQTLAKEEIGWSDFPSVEWGWQGPRRWGWELGATCESGPSMATCPSLVYESDLCLTKPEDVYCHLTMYQAWCWAYFHFCSIKTRIQTLQDCCGIYTCVMCILR